MHHSQIPCCDSTWHFASVFIRLANNSISTQSPQDKPIKWDQSCFSFYPLDGITYNAQLPRMIKKVDTTLFGKLLRGYCHWMRVNVCTFCTVFMTCDFTPPNLEIMVTIPVYIRAFEWPIISKWLNVARTLVISCKIMKKENKQLYKCFGQSQNSFNLIFQTEIK